MVVADGRSFTRIKNKCSNITHPYGTPHVIVRPSERLS